MDVRWEKAEDSSHHRGAMSGVDAKFDNVKMMIDTAKTYRGKY